MRQISVEKLFGFSSSIRHGVVCLPNDRLALCSGAILIILEISTGARQFVSFSSIEFLSSSARSKFLFLIDRSADEKNCSKIEILSTEPIRRILTIEPDRFGRFRSLATNFDENLLLILHDEPNFVLTIRKKIRKKKTKIFFSFLFTQDEILFNSEEENPLILVDISSVRLVHGPIVRSSSNETFFPTVDSISFAKFSSKNFLVTGNSTLKIFQIEQNSIEQQNLDFRAELFNFTSHSSLDEKTFLVGTDRRHVFAFQNGSIRADFNLDQIVRSIYSTDENSTAEKVSPKTIVEISVLDEQRGQFVVAFDKFLLLVS